MSVHSSEIFDDGMLLGFRAPTTFEARQMRPGEPQLSIAISREEMDELTKPDVNFHNIDFDLQKGAGIFINIEYERITLSPISRDAYVEMLKRQMIE